jgi:hypothetical protein
MRDKPQELRAEALNATPALQNTGRAGRSPPSDDSNRHPGSLAYTTTRFSPFQLNLRRRRFKAVVSALRRTIGTAKRYSQY